MSPIGPSRNWCHVRVETENLRTTDIRCRVNQSVNALKPAPGMTAHPCDLRKCANALSVVSET